MAHAPFLPQLAKRLPGQAPEPGAAGYLQNLLVRTGTHRCKDVLPGAGGHDQQGQGSGSAEGSVIGHPSSHPVCLILLKQSPALARCWICA